MGVFHNEINLEKFWESLMFLTKMLFHFILKKSQHKKNHNLQIKPNK